MDHELNDMDHGLINNMDHELNVLDHELNDLVASRTEFENYLYDFLIDRFESFWEPVIVPFTETHKIKSIYSKEECTICGQHCTFFKKVKCCGQQLCCECCSKWFDVSVKCPYCMRDLRDFY